MPPTCKQDGSSACRNTTFYKHTGRRGTSVTICAPLNGGTPAGFTWKTVQPAAPERFSADATGTGLTPSPARWDVCRTHTCSVIAFVSDMIPLFEGNCKGGEEEFFSMIQRSRKNGEGRRIGCGLSANPHKKMTARFYDSFF